jgi:hypothetical protein
MTATLLIDMRYLSDTLHLLLIGLVGLGLTGCDFTEGYNEDPNSPTDAPSNLTLNSAQVGSMVFQEDNYARIAGIWSGQLTGGQRQYSGLDSYNTTASGFDNMWTTAYADVIGDLQPVKADARASGNRLVLGIAKTIEAHTHGTLAAVHGSVPFGEAAAGNENLNPAFTDQATIYGNVVDSLDGSNGAIQDLQAGGVSPGSQDVFFGGDAQAWIEVAYTLKARYLLHQGNYSGALAAARNGISSSEKNMMGPHGNSNNNNANPFYLFHDIERSGYLTATNSHAAELLDSATNQYRGNAKTDESGRLNYYFTGSQGGYDLNTSEDAYFGQASDYPLVTYVENELIKAEALLQANAPNPSNSVLSDALTALNNAREANDQKLGTGTNYYDDYELSDFSSGGIANSGSSQANALLSEILEEKYLSMMGHIEAFNDVRRTENFIGVPLKSNSASSLPQRYLIAQTEINANDNAPDSPPGVFETTPVNGSVSYSGVSGN